MLYGGYGGGGLGCFVGVEVVDDVGVCVYGYGYCFFGCFYVVVCLVYVDVGDGVVVGYYMVLEFLFVV